MSTAMDIDDIQRVFFEECAEGLDTAEKSLTAMLGGDCSVETIASVFRAIHSIKGGAGAFGHVALTTFAHRFETLLDEIRSGRIPPLPDVIRAMLSALDVLSDHVAAAQSGAGAPADQVILATLDTILAGGASAAAAPVAPASDDFGFTPVSIELDMLDALEAPAGGEAQNASAARWIVTFAPSRTAMANGGEPLLVIRELERMGGVITSVDRTALPPLRELDPENGYLRWTLSLPETVEQAEIGECFDFVAPDSVVTIERLAEPDVTLPGAVPVAANDGQDRAETIEASRPSEPAAQTIRVDLNKLDMLLNLVGELVIRGSILADRLSAQEQERVELPELSRLTREIQDNVMSLRAQPIRHAFSRVPRLLRDLTAETGKTVMLETSGETTEVDKGVIEKIGEPLTHMIRNAVDHGIESSQDRLAAGKPAKGLIRLSAEQKGGRILVSVRDDGRGINRERVFAKAVERGIIGPDASLSDQEIDSLICAPGFSTAETVSNISGRGVGMDVVRSNVEAMGGRVEISSTPGEGATFTMVLPLTLAILDGMIVRLGRQRFVLPLANVIEAVKPEAGQVRPLTPTSEVIDLRGTYLPVRRLGDLLGIAGLERRRAEDCPVIIVESEVSGHVGLMVDAIDDRREVVIKSLDANLHPIRGLGGATILGDGSIALILDIDALVATAAGTGVRYAMKGLAA
ncbi:chemotaxis protein CheA [Iodidimonas sp. SYSU 1G8]|uniref:chemotaxis protein CheA n=1 Tax=Iodidimonas sp. SYSU 1G8 TaxID=3133967 RepID=UPI0031FF3006